MSHVSRFKLTLGALALLATLGAGAAMAEDKPMASGSGVTFKNDSSHAIEIFARYGSEGSCAHQAKEVELQVAANTTSTVDSGESKVCFCLEVPARNACPTGWVEVKAGGTRVLH